MGRVPASRVMSPPGGSGAAGPRLWAAVRRNIRMIRGRPQPGVGVTKARRRAVAGRRNGALYVYTYMGTAGTTEWALADVFGIVSDTAPDRDAIVWRERRQTFAA